MVGRVELGVDVVEARKAEVDVHRVRIVIDALEIRLLGADAAVLEDAGEADAPGAR